MNEGESWFVANKSITCIAFAIVLAFAFDYLFIWKLPGLSAPVFTILIGISLVALTFLYKRKLSLDVLWLLALAVFFSAMVAVRSNILLTVLNIFGTLLLLLMVTEVNVRGSIREFIAFDYVKIFALPVVYLISLVDTVASVRLPFAKPVSDRSKQIIRGVLITAPVIALFAGLFAGADPVFHKVLSTIFYLHFPSPEHPFVILVVFAFVCGALSYTFSKESSVKSATTSPRRPMGHIETSILLCSVNALFVIFIGLQATYFFGGAGNIIYDTFTYAEYARRGFFELIAISAFTYLIMLATEKLIERDTEHHSKPFKYLSTALVVQVLVLMIFAFNRLSLYESVFGFTTLRLYSHAFIVLLAVIYLFLIYKIYIDTRESAFSLRTFFAIVVFVAGMNLLNPDSFIAKKNLERFDATGKIDFEYLAGLSSDATPVLITVFDKGYATERSPLGRALYDRSAAGSETWQSWNLSRINEKALLNTCSAQFEQYKNYQKE